MAEFTADFQSFRPFLFPDIDPNMELMYQFAELNPSGVLDNSQLNLQNFVGVSNDNFSQQAPEFLDNFPGIFHPNDPITAAVPQPVAAAQDEVVLECKKRKAHDISESTSGNSSAPTSETGIQFQRKNSSRRGKRVKGSDKEENKAKEVVHVRARRGQATDSHSLAERVRRGKINERLKCLQDIVPGCYKTMGMAMMLDEIINYVQSLQNQVEFLSMKLTAASTFYDFNSESDAVEEMQKAKAYEAKEVGRLMMKEGDGGNASIHSTAAWPF